MNETLYSSVKVRLIEKLRLAFLALGYSGITMKELAEFCGLTRRALYHHFRSKDDAFRAMIGHHGYQSIALGLAAANEAIDTGVTPDRVFAKLFDVRYGRARRELAASHHAQDVNDMAFLLCRDIMIAQADALHGHMADLLRDMQKRGLFSIKTSVSPKHLAKMLADGARGANQSLPPMPIADLPTAYREMARAILYGCLEPNSAKSRASERKK
jgi:AcrR family transcriptional regulator